MDLDNMTDIEVLRNIAKSYMVQMKRDTEANDGTDYIFKKGYWYFLDQDETGITVYIEDSFHACFLGYDEADIFLVSKQMKDCFRKEILNERKFSLYVRY